MQNQLRLPNIWSFSSSTLSLTLQSYKVEWLIDCTRMLRNNVGNMNINMKGLWIGILNYFGGEIWKKKKLNSSGY